MTTQSATLPWTKSCFVCGQDNDQGLKCKSRVEGDSVVLDYTTRPSDVGYKTIIHGGIGITLLDEVMTWASILAMNTMCVAAELTTRLKRPLEVNTSVQARGWVEKQARKLCFTRAELRDAAGTIFLSAQGKYMPMDDSMQECVHKDFVVDNSCIPLETLFPDK